MSNTEAFNKDIHDILTRYITGDKGGLEELYNYSYYPEIRDKLRYRKRDSKYEPTYQDIEDNMPFFSGNYWNVLMDDLNDAGIGRIISGLKYKHKDLNFDNSEVSDRVSALRKFLEENNSLRNFADHDSSFDYHRRSFDYERRGLGYQRRKRNQEKLQKELDELFSVQETPITHADVHQPQNMWEDSEFPALSRLPSHIPNENLTPEDREAIIQSLKMDTAKNTSNTSNTSSNFTDFDEDKFFEDAINEYRQSDTHKKIARAMGWSR